MYTHIQRVTDRRERRNAMSYMWNHKGKTKMWNGLVRREIAHVWFTNTYSKNAQHLYYLWLNYDVYNIFYVTGYSLLSNFSSSVAIIWQRTFDNCNLIFLLIDLILFPRDEPSEFVSTTIAHTVKNKRKILEGFMPSHSSSSYNDKLNYNSKFDIKCIVIVEAKHFSRRRL